MVLVSLKLALLFFPIFSDFVFLNNFFIVNLGGILIGNKKEGEYKGSH